jgi:dTDP-4-amino-4,6-dideoxygalactose transaminase
MAASPLPFIDFAAQRARIGSRIEIAIARVLDRQDFIMGREVAELEEALAAFCGAPRAIGCANGTDALLLALMALGVRGGDAVFCPSFTFAATAEVVPFTGALPVFVDIDGDTLLIDPESLARAIESARRAGLRPAGVISVDLFGVPADYDALHAVANANGLWIVADAAQSFGARRGNAHVGTLAPITTTSFFPAKPLGCFGDGGAVLCADPAQATLIDSFRVHGKGSDKYDNVRIGMNSRLDTLQAAILLEKLAIFPEEIEARQRAAARYDALLSHCAGAVARPVIPAGCASSWAQYTVRLPRGTDRAAVQARMQADGIPTAIYYPRPLHLQTAYRDFPADPRGLAASEQAAARVLSLPMHPYLTETDQERVVVSLAAALQRAA